MPSALKALLAGLVLGIAGTLLVVHFTGPSQSVPEKLEEALQCEDGPVDQTAAIAHHTAGYSAWAATHAMRLMGIGCDAGPATIYMRFSPYRSTLAHALATMRGYGPVCVVDSGLFGGRSLGGGLLNDLCDEVGGEVRRL
jgi:hypothetical protein